MLNHKLMKIINDFVILNNEFFIFLTIQLTLFY